MQIEESSAVCMVGDLISNCQSDPDQKQEVDNSQPQTCTDGNGDSDTVKNDHGTNGDDAKNVQSQNASLFDDFESDIDNDFDDGNLMRENEKEQVSPTQLRPKAKAVGLQSIGTMPLSGTRSASRKVTPSPWKCPGCDTVSQNRYDLLKHLRSKHGEDVSQLQQFDEEVSRSDKRGVELACPLCGVTRRGWGVFMHL